MRRDLTSGTNIFDEEENPFRFEPGERTQVKLLVIEPDQQDRATARSAIDPLGFHSVYYASDHAQGLAAVSEREFTHAIFSATQTLMPVKEFLGKLLRLDPKIVALPTSGDPRIDEVFELLAIGARGYLVKPYNGDSFDRAVSMATKGEPLSEVILQAEDRNKVFAAVIASGVDKVAVAFRQADTYISVEKALPRIKGDLKNSVDLARMFPKGGEEVLQRAIIDFFIELSEGPATKLGRLRERLKQQRLAKKAASLAEKDSTDSESSTGPSVGVERGPR